MTGGSEFVVLSKAGQGYTLVDGSYLAYEAGGFYSSNNSAGNTLLGFYANGTGSLTFNTTAVQLNGNQILHAGNYTSYAPSLGGSGASGTWGINITGNAGTAYGLNYGQLFNNAGNGHGSWSDFNNVPGFGAYFVQGNGNGPSTASQYYGFTLGLGNDYAYSSYAAQFAIPRIPSGGSNGNLYLGVRFREGGGWGSWYKAASGYSDNSGLLNGYSSAESGGSVVLRTASNGYLYINNWIHTASGGLFSSVNGAHFYPNNTEYGSWRISGSRSGWHGIYFDSGANLMANSNEVGFHRAGHGWMIRWLAGTGYVHKGDPGGGTSATILDSSNYTSYSPPYSGGTLTGTWYFQSNRDTSSNSAPLQAYSTSGGATMAFHRAGVYAVNMGLDSDNVFRIGGWSAGNNRLQMDMSGNLTMAGFVRSSNNVYIDQNYGHGHVGVYDSYRYQGVFFMGDSYKMSADGTSLANMYGIGWSHPNAGGAAGNLTDHGMLIINNGSFRCAISNSIVASGNITAYSDERLKRNWRDMPENFVERLAQVRVGCYERIDDGTQQVGVSAQSLQPLLPEAIQIAKDEIGTLSVSYGNAAMASAVELAKELVALKRKVTELEARIH
jgi:hypothetical protein